MNHKVIAVTTFFALLQFIQAVYSVQTGCNVMFDSTNSVCHFNWKNSTECVGARDYFLRFLNCKSQFGAESGCREFVKDCTKEANTFSDRCYDIGGVLYKKPPPDSGKCEQNNQ